MASGAIREGRVAAKARGGRALEAAAEASPGSFLKSKAPWGGSGCGLADCRLFWPVKTGQGQNTETYTERGWG